MFRPALLLALSSCLQSVDAHGFMTTPKSRNIVVCDNIWPDYLKVCLLPLLAKKNLACDPSRYE